MVPVWLSSSGLNSQVLASNNEMVILPVNEPTFGTPRKSQIQTYLEQNEVQCNWIVNSHHTWAVRRLSYIACWLDEWRSARGSACWSQGPGLQHLALKTNNIVATLRKMRRVSACGGFDFMPPLDNSYYQ